MAAKLDSNQVQKWQAFWEATKDEQLAKWPQGYHAKRESVKKEMLAFLGDYLSGKLTTEDFRSTFDQKTRHEWDVFGLKGPSGAMFLNMLVKHLPDQQALTAQLKSVLKAPADVTVGKDAMRSFAKYLQSAIDTGVTTKRAINVPRVPFIVSGWWHLQDTENWPIHYLSGRQALATEETYIPQPDPVDDYFAFRECFLALAAELGFTSWQVEHLLAWHSEDGGHKPVSPQLNVPAVKVPIDPPTQTTTESEKEDKTSTTHTLIQWWLARIGKKMGCKVWIATNDQGRECNGEKLGSYSINDFPALGLDPESQKIIRLIDVVWLKGPHQVVAAFEVEQSTSIYSGLLRMSDLTVLAPNLAFPIYIVVPESRLKDVKRELSRPTFQSLELHKRCGYFSAEQLLLQSEQILKWATHPAVIDDNLAQHVADVL